MKNNGKKKEESSEIKLAKFIRKNKITVRKENKGGEEKMSENEGKKE